MKCLLISSLLCKNAEISTIKKNYEIMYFLISILGNCVGSILKQ